MGWGGVMREGDEEGLVRFVGGCGKRVLAVRWEVRHD